MVNLHRSFSLATFLIVSLGTLEVSAVFTDCGGQLSFQAGNIISPNFPSSYPNDAECKWLISVADNQIIDFRFKRLDLDRYYDQNCIDYIRIYNGPTEQDPLIGTYCGYNDVTAAVNIIVRSKTNELLVVFKSDASGTKTGFSATYWAHECLPFKYGMEICNNSCACNATNAYYCHNQYGNCQCNSNWTGWDCSALIPHCLNPNDCTDPYSVCVNVPGRYECSCKPGLVKNEKGECEDPKQCSVKKCSHACGVTSTNPYTETCHCPKGMKMHPYNNEKCVECPSWTYGENCAYWTYCDSYRTESYNKANGLCSCYLNWTSTYCSQDVDECALEKTPCNTTHGKCLNTYGSYECICMAGYETSNGIICNECGQTLLAPAAKIQSRAKYGDSKSTIECSWRIKVPDGLVISMSFQRYEMYGSWWYCTEGYIVVYDGSDTNGTLLYSGYKPTVSTLPSIIRSFGNEIYIVRYKSSCGWTNGFDAIYWSHKCQKGMYDSNCSTPCKCVLSNSECDSVSGKCSCHQGWTSSDCSIDINECNDITLCPDYSTCHNLPGSYECRCWDGMVMDSNNQCVTNNVSSLCTNRNCSHVCVSVTPPDEVSPVETCYCPSFMELDGDQCVDCIGLKHGRYCQENCLCNENNTATCNPITGQCNCYYGWKGNSCDQDDNECLVGWKFNCPAYSFCVNTPGSYRCECDTKQWYLDSDGGSCVLKQCEYTMTNSTGEIMNPYYPENPPVYVKCFWNITVDEGNIITIRFTNLFYPYNWYYTNIAGITFYDGIDARSNQLTVHRFSPPAAFVRSTGNHLYIVFEESNTVGGLFYGMYSAEDCPKNMYGDDCSIPCPCVADNSVCNNVDGTCKCLTGWTGSDCSIDINECLQDYVCPLFSKCYNKNGSYECRCYDGLKMSFNRQCVLHENSTSCTEKHCQSLCARFTPENQTSPIEQCYCEWHMELDGDKCVECKGLKYGIYCDKQCDCPENTTADCNVNNGYCICMANWTGYRCSYDFDECIYGRHSCPPHTYCSNTWGGYNCLCNPLDGYIASGDGSCVRIECNHEMNNVTGIVSAGNYSYSPYTNNAYCTWNITAEKGNVISLRFTVFSTQYLYDYMDIYDGASSASPVIGRYSGYGANIIRTTGNYMYIVFVSDANSVGYFYGNYYSLKCPNFTYGIENCDKKCRCVKENTQFCDNINGECICKSGWTMGDCSVDVNECLGTNNRVCPTNSDCVNTKGSYRCDCHLGFVFNNNTRTCDENYNCFRKKCSHSCYIVTKGVEQCVCPEGLELDEETDLTCRVPYFPFGSKVGDIRLGDDYISFGDKHISKPIYFNSGVPFGENHHAAACVSSNGAISFGDRSEQLGSSVDLTFLDEQNLKVLAPFMANINPETGDVFYHLYEKYGNIFGDSKDEQPSPEMNNVLSRAKRNIEEYYGLYSFDVNTVLVVTWAAVKPFTLSKENKEENTFQAVYISGYEKVYQGGKTFYSDEETSYVIFIYQYGKMNWNYVPGRAVSIGVTGKMFNSLKDLDSPLVSLLDKVPGNKGYNGVVSFEVGRVKGTEQSCTNYLRNHLNLLHDGQYHYESDSIYQCPCTMERLGNQWELYEKRGTNQDIHCYAISARAKRRFYSSNPRNQLCCYKWVKPGSNESG